jgi:hypothetical protein
MAKLANNPRRAHLKRMKGDQYIFRIDRFTPETIPMARLADYISELAALLGASERVHFKKVKRGSVQIVSAVEIEAQPKVRARLQSLESTEAPTDVREAFETLNGYLEEDNAVGSIKRGSTVILKFPGRTRPRPPQIGPFTQPTELVGQLVRVGGRDKTAHAQLEDPEGRAWPIVMTREEARQLAPLLYGPTIRASGPGRWTRTPAGTWELEYLKLQSWEKLSEETLREAVDQLRKIEGSQWHLEADPAAFLSRIRHGDDEVQ